MTAKDYRKIAEVLKEAAPFRLPSHVLVERFVKMLQDDSLRFDAESFRRACKIEL